MIKRLDKEHSSISMDEEEAKSIYEEIKKAHGDLKEYGVSLSKYGTAKAYWLIFLVKHKGKMVHKDTISSFVSQRTKLGKDQQVRHLAAYGWYVLNKEG